LSLLLTVALLYLHTECSEPLLFMVQIPLAIGVGVAYVLARIFSPTHASRWQPVAAAIGVASLVSLIGMRQIYPWQNEQTRQQAAVYISKLDQYYQEHGHYPQQAAQLVPTYLPRLPTTARGLFSRRPFQYQSGPNPTPGAVQAPEFRLSYYAGAAVDATYWSKTKQWTSDD